VVSLHQKPQIILIRSGQVIRPAIWHNYFNIKISQKFTLKPHVEQMSWYFLYKHSVHRRNIPLSGLFHVGEDFSHAAVAIPPASRQNSPPSPRNSPKPSEFPTIPSEFPPFFDYESLKDLKTRLSDVIVELCTLNMIEVQQQQKIISCASRFFGETTICKIRQDIRSHQSSFVITSPRAHLGLDSGGSTGGGGNPAMAPSIDFGIRLFPSPSKK